MDIFRFHLRVGARVGIRWLAPLLAGFFAAYYLLRPEFFVMLGDRLFFRGPRLARGVMLTLILLPAANTLAARIAWGLSGWIRHLPAPASRHRRGAAMALLIAMTPLLIILAGMALLPAGKNGTGEAFTAIIGIGAAAAVISVLVLPVRRPAWADLLGLAAGVLAGTGDPIGIGAGLTAAAAVAGVSGPFLVPLRRGPLRSGLSAPLAFSFIQHARAFGARIMLPYLPAAAILGLTALMLSNNPLPAEAAAAASRFGAAAALTSWLSVAAAVSAKRRPPWGWGRSLPVSAFRRVAADALFLTVPAAPVLAASAFLDLRAALATAVLIPYLAMRAAASLRPTPESVRSPIPALILEGLAAASMLALWPWLAAGLIPAAVFAARNAARRERSLKVGRWLELRFSAAGDSLTGRST
jgi:hypothetical protein